MALLFGGASSAYAQAFPSTSAIDNFNRAAPLGANWITDPACSDGMTISGSTVAISAVAGYGCARYDAATYGADSETFATIATLPNSGLDMGLSVRSGNYGVTLINVSGSNNDVAQISKPGTPSIGGDCALSMDLAAGQVWGLRALGDQITVYVNGTLKCTRTDATHAGGGKLGMYASDPPNAWDDFGGGTMPATAGCTGGGLLLGAGRC
jgi:hypothetical protein